MADGLTLDEQRDILDRIAAYRRVCAQVRASSGGSLIFGLIMLGLWYSIFGQHGNYNLFSICYLIIASLELGVGLVNRLFPSAEGVLFDGFVLIAFGGVNLFRVFILWNGGVGIPYVSLFLGLYWLWTGGNHFRSYLQLLKVFSPRPTAEHLRWYAGLLSDVRKANPQHDRNALDLPSNPPLRALLLGDLAMIVEPGSDEIAVFDRVDVRLVPLELNPTSGQRQATLTLAGTRIDSFTLDPDNWRNYSEWKRAGGEAVPSVNMT